jgi:hypothetical protein
MWTTVRQDSWKTTFIPPANQIFAQALDTDRLALAKFLRL